ncbi:hypothetical protein VTL71DRAFT_13742 [Oculimacula yallundae]|uniref:Uncharacterized protein n=1 Tax=Oculimacula yallundae TaxID=86028 RepID=A0ABR4CMV6_9HELO
MSKKILNEAREASWRRAYHIVFSWKIEGYARLRDSSEAISRFVMDFTNDHRGNSDSTFTKSVGCCPAHSVGRLGIW